MRTRITLVLAVVFSIAVPGQAQNLVSNGGFEFPVPGVGCVDQGGWCFFASGLPGLGWVVEWADTLGSVGNLEVQRLGGPAEGFQHVELDTHGRVGSGDNNVRIFQDLTACPGTYPLSYFWRPRPSIVSDQTLEVRWGGATLVNHSASNTPGATSWTQDTFSVSSSFAAKRLEFISGGVGDTLGMFLDGVVLAAPNANVANSCTTINVKPGSNPNSINVCTSGAIPVTIWGSATFDVTWIDPTKLSLGSAAVKTVGKTDKYLCSISDVGRPDSSAFDGIGTPDGYADMTCHFITEPNMFPAGATTGTLSMTICANGFSDGCTAGLAITATDTVNLVKEGCN